MPAKEQGLKYFQCKFLKYVSFSFNKTGTSKVGAISKAQKAQFSKYAQDVFMKSFENTFETPKCAFHARYDWKITFLDWKQKNFWKFFWNFFLKKFFFEKTSKTSHSAEKWKGGTLWDSLTYFLLQNIKKSEGGTLLKNWKFSKKKFAQCRKKIERGDPLESSGFVGYVKKVKNERGTLCSKFALVELGLSELISFCKKWYIRDELCGLTKKKEKKKKLATVIVGLFSLKENAPTKNNVKI